MTMSQSTKAQKAEIEQHALPLWLSSIALLGDSPVAMFFSVVLFLSSIILSVWIRQNSDFGTSDPYLSLGPIPKLEHPPTIYHYSPAIIDDLKRAYRKDGVVAVRGLIPDTLLDRE
jgi:hypothetical protein